MQLHARDFSDESRYLWTDLPGASSTLSGRQTRSAPETLRQFID